jgi:uncharacterized membrane protein (DUF485 family)
VAETVDQGAKHEVYERLHATADFRELRRRYRGFAIPWTVAFLSWYLLYVVMSNWAHDFMSQQLFGHVNVALAFGVLQFVSTFAIARLYATHANKELDPLAEKLRDQYERETGGEAPNRPGDDEGVTA